MKVTVASALIADGGERRGRICLRSDGRYQFVTERLTQATDDVLPYWLNEYPPSGIYDRQEDAAAALQATLGQASPIEDVEPVEFNLEIGPYPPLG
jgi:hypothetical protein